MTAPDAFGLAVSGGASMRTLDRVECLEFLPTKKVGRLGYVTDDGPRIVPLNYDIDEFLQTGLSVLVVGTAKLVSVEELKQIMSVGGPEPWAGGPRTLFLRIPLTTVTGRQVLAP